MQWLDSNRDWGWFSIALHWLIALAVFGLFGLGLWMTSLDYYDPWYRRAPDLHRSIGAVLLLVTAVRIPWRWLNPTPDPIASHRLWETILAKISHTLLYTIPLVLGLSGYLISTADGRALAVFDWFEIPAIYTGIEQQEEVMGDVHEVLAWSVIVIAAMHAMGALKHHLVDRDATLTRMLQPKSENTQKGEHR